MIYIIVEAGYGVKNAEVVRNTDGTVLLFNKESEAINTAKHECQEGVVVPIQDSLNF